MLLGAGCEDSKKTLRGVAELVQWPGGFTDTL